MTSAVNFQRDAQGQNTYAPNIDGVEFRYAVTLAAGVAQSFTLPRGVKPWVVSFAATPGAEVWYAFSFPWQSPITAAVPTGTVALTNSEMNVGARTMTPETTISMIAAAANVSVSIVLWNSPS